MTAIAAISQQIWDMKYRFRGSDRLREDKTIGDSWQRIAGRHAAQAAAA